VKFTIRELYDGEVINMEYAGVSTYLPNVIMSELSEVVAYIWFKVDNKTMHINMIEVVEKEQGIGTRIVMYLFETYDIEIIEGETLREDSGRPYYFWSSLGAVFPEGEEWGHLDPIRDNIPFTLLSPSLPGGVE
jgi:hypothetical protein